MEVKVNSVKGASGALMERCLLSSSVLTFFSFTPETREGHEESGDVIVRFSFCLSGANRTGNALLEETTGCRWDGFYLRLGGQEEVPARSC